MKSCLQPNCTAHSFSEERDRNHGAVLEMPVGAVPKQGNGKHKVVVGRLQGVRVPSHYRAAWGHATATDWERSADKPGLTSAHV